MTRPMRWLAILGMLLGLPTLAWAQSDLGVQQFNLPASNTLGYRVHTSTSAMSVTIQDKISAAGGYKLALIYGHAGNMAVNQSNTGLPLLGTATTGEGGVLYHRPPYAGSIIAVGIQGSAALTAGAAHTEATVLHNLTGTVVGTGLRAVIGGTLSNTQYATATQGRGVDNFDTGDGIGCRITSDASMLPVTSILVCHVIVEY